MSEMNWTEPSLSKQGLKSDHVDFDDDHDDNYVFYDGDDDDDRFDVIISIIVMVMLIPITSWSKRPAKRSYTRSIQVRKRRRKRL